MKADFNVISASTAILLMCAGLACAETAPAPTTANSPSHSRAADCSKAPNPAKCEEKRAKTREHIAAAKSACAGKQGEERHLCITDSLCAKAADPRKCQEQAKIRAEHRPQVLKICADKRGDEHRNCMREEYLKLAPVK